MKACAYHVAGLTCSVCDPETAYGKEPEERDEVQPGSGADIRIGDFEERADCSCSACVSVRAKRGAS